MKFITPNTDDLNDSSATSASLTEQEREAEMKLLILKFRHDFSEDIEPPVEVLRIGHAIWGTTGNFSAVIGKAKSRKTFLVTMALAALSHNSAVCDIFAKLPDGREKVLFFDTEQSAWHVRQIVNRVKHLANLTTQELAKNLHIYQLREAENVQQRKDFIRQVIYSTPGIGIVIIDGIRDLVRSINDEGEASDMVCNLMQWSSELDIHIVAVLHTNKNDANARGHIGTELMNKAETALMVEKNQMDEDISIVTAEYSRNKEFPPFAFTVDSDGIPYCTDAPKDNRRKPMADEITEEQYRDCCEDWENFSKVEAKSAIMRYFEIGDNKSREYLQFMVDKGYVKQSKVSGKNSFRYDG